MLNPRFFPGCSKRPRCKAAGRRPGYPVRWVQAYWRYAAASAEAGQRRRWAFLSSLLTLAPSAGF